MIHEIAVPKGLDKGVGEPENQKVLDGFLAQVMIDPVHLLLVEMPVQLLVQLAGGRQVPAEGLLDHDAVAAVGPVQPDPVQLVHHRQEIFGADGQIEDDVLAVAHSRPAEHLEQPVIGSGVVEIAAEILETPRETRKGGLVHGTADSRAHRNGEVLPPVGVVPWPAPHGHEQQIVVEPPGGIQLVERRQQLDLGQVPCGPEYDEMARAWGAVLRHPSSPLLGTTAWPPKPLRIIARILWP